MIEETSSYTFSKISLEEARKIAKTGVESAVGHKDTANVFSNLLNADVPVNRITVSSPDRMLVGQYTGQRLPEGCSVLPEGSKIEWWLMSKINWDYIKRYYEGRG